MEAVLCSKKRTDDYLWVINEVYVQTWRSSYFHLYVKMLRDEEWKEVDGVMYKEEKVYVLKDDRLRAEIIRLHHDTPVGGYGRQ